MREQPHELSGAKQPESHAPDFTLALEEARRGFDQLTSEFNRTRDRAASALSIGGLSAAFLGGLALRTEDDALSVWTGLAVAAFIGLTSTTLYIFWPRKMWSTIDPAALIKWSTGDKASGSDPMPPNWQTMYLARHIGEGYDRNFPTVSRLGTAYSLGILALGLEVVFLIVDLATR